MAITPATEIETRQRGDETAQTKVHLKLPQQRDTEGGTETEREGEKEMQRETELG